jgi:hypothetical protein
VLYCLQWRIISKTLNPAYVNQRNFLIRSRWEYDDLVESRSTGVLLISAIESVEMLI